jgi:hypothetical protein
MLDFTGASVLFKIYVRVYNCICLLPLGDYQVHDLSSLKLLDTRIWEAVLLTVYCTCSVKSKHESHNIGRIVKTVAVISTGWATEK